MSSTPGCMKRTREWLKAKSYPYNLDSRWDVWGGESQFLVALNSLLAEREAQARLEEAKDWLVVVESLLKLSKKDQHAKRCVSECRQRVADLELATLRTDGKPGGTQR